MATGKIELVEGSKREAGTPRSLTSNFCIPRSNLTAGDRLLLSAAQFWAKVNGTTVGFGSGASVALGFLRTGAVRLGIQYSESRILVADPAGNAGILSSTSIGPAGASTGFAGLAGLQVLNSVSPVSGLTGHSSTVSASVGPGLGAGVDVSPGSGTVVTTVGLAAGAKVSGGVPVGPSVLTSICPD